MEANQQAALYAALAKAQGEFAALAKNREVEITMRTGGRYKFRYADLEAVLSATRPALAANGLAVVQRVVPVTGANFSELVTALLHQDGGSIESAIQLPSNGGGDIKNYGATISYLRRYALTSLLCVAADDDLDEDGQEAGGAGYVQQERPHKQAAPSPPEADGGGLPLYPEEQLMQNLPAWQRAVSEGKTTPERIIKMASSKGLLSPKQIKTIEALANKSQQGDSEQ